MSASVVMDSLSTPVSDHGPRGANRDMEIDENQVQHQQSPSLLLARMTPSTTTTTTTSTSTTTTTATTSTSLETSFLSHTPHLVSRNQPRQQILLTPESSADECQDARARPTSAAAIGECTTAGGAADGSCTAEATAPPIMSQAATGSAPVASHEPPATGTPQSTLPRAQTSSSSPCHQSNGHVVARFDHETSEQKCDAPALHPAAISASPRRTLSSIPDVDPVKPQRPIPGANNNNSLDAIVAMNTDWGSPPSSYALGSSPSSPSSPGHIPFPPLQTTTVHADTLIAHPKPITLPSSASSTPLPTSQHSSRALSRHLHDLPEQHIRNSAFVGNVAQLEATAERLSTGTSSIGDAIRELHDGLKQSDSRRSSTLAANLRAAQGDDHPHELPPVGQLKRHLSNSSSIVATNAAARYGGYSPAGFIMSPTNSMTGRLRSGSKNSSGRPADLDFEPMVMARHGPGKASVSSVRSAKMSLAEIIELEPTSLTKDALDAADNAPPIEVDPSLQEVTAAPLGTDEDSTPTGDASVQQAMPTTPSQQQGKVMRKSSIRSVNTFQQAMEAFGDFDGVHWQPEMDQHADHEYEHDQLDASFEHLGQMSHGDAQHEPSQLRYHMASPKDPRPQSYTDPETGQKMLYYPARVPALLNLPPKLSNKPKKEQRQERRSRVLSAMLPSDKYAEEHEVAQPRRRSAMPDTSRESWLPDPLAGHRGSFIALSQDVPNDSPDQEAREEDLTPPAEPGTALLRRPQRLSHNGQDKVKKTESQLPPQLRASAFFDMPTTQSKVEVQDGSAMATLDNMLDASTNAPVGAFTNHGYGGKLGDEVYGKEKKTKKHKSKLSSASLQPEAAAKQPTKKRSSRSWFMRRSSSNLDEATAHRSRSPSALGDVHGDTAATETEALAASGDEKSRQGDAREAEGEDADEQDSSSDSEPELDGQPTTLLAELQLRKQQQKHRTQPRLTTEGSYMTLLEMDAVAETQRKHRQTKRINLAWEEPGAHAAQNGSDDEDVPLAIIAAKHQGAKNMADLERPIGLLERREIDDNEPLSRRRARLQGKEPMSLALPKRQSMSGLSAHLGGHARTPSSLPRTPMKTPEPEEPEIEEETLGARKKRLETHELPKARPVSSSFSAELLSQFGDLDHGKGTPGEGGGPEITSTSPAAEEEETLGQRRRRLQAEREAREREMSYNNLVGDSVVTRRLSMADMLQAHPKRERDTRAQRERQRVEQERQAQAAREAQMAAMRAHMPTSLKSPSVMRAGGFRSGAYNDGYGGNIQASRSSSAVHNQNQGQMHTLKNQRSTTAMSAYGMPTPQTPYAVNPMGATGPLGGHHMRSTSGYNHGNMQLPGHMGMPGDPSPASMTRVEQWRHGVMP
ncbi:uncharacterized protein J7T54_001455 [Emericellopsis cladophorae]|uniref:Uncharacterized protein n=1 Tax=Emericellopsis cladophorae TaxID=2686198 RepID=A0A9P9Y1L6_9HYPO|nr:uncharacterized protein J7T54_001455 [Emericellopsis cladophorae]KAI6781493.1 hypothetical protein J7T54_001455 [Emericellopsis cladophorae]